MKFVKIFYFSSFTSFFAFHPRYNMLLIFQRDFKTLKIMTFKSARELVKAGVTSLCTFSVTMSTKCAINCINFNFDYDKSHEKMKFKLNPRTMLSRWLLFSVSVVLNFGWFPWVRLWEMFARSSEHDDR